jgi:hypothetical protein
MNAATDRVRQFIRVRQDSDHQYLAYRPAMDGLLINANQMEHHATATTALIHKLELPYLIDPMLWRFQVPSWWLRLDDPTRPTVKVNFRNLADRYFADTAVGGAEGGLPTNLADSDWRMIASNVVAYQNARVVEQEGPLFALVDAPTRPLEIIAPYLLAHDADEDRINTLLLRAAAEAANRKILACIALPIERFQTGAHLQTIVSAVSSDLAAGCFIWIERLSEAALVQSDTHMDTLEWLLDRLSAKDVPVWQANGGFCSAAMRDWGVTGIAHSLAWRDHGMPAAPATGIPRHSCHTYVTGLHVSKHYDEASVLGRPLSSETYQRLYCNCQFCVGAWENDQHPLDLMLQVTAVKGSRGRTAYVPSEQALAANTWHYLWSRRLEVLSFDQASTIDVLMREIDRGVELKGEAATLRRLARRLRPAS